MASSDEREGHSEEREGISESASDEVEAHSLGDRPIERADEGDDVEAHVLSESPPGE